MLVNTLVVYDATGKIYYQSSGTYTIPTGLLYLETQLDIDKNVVISVDTSVEPHTPIIVPKIALSCTLEQYKEEMIRQLEDSFAKYLENNPIESTCHGEPKLYTITKDKQILLMNEIRMAEKSRELGIEYIATWNADNEESEEWSLEQLWQLAFEISNAVKPLLADEQAIDKEIRKANSFEELFEIDYLFE